jgi:hypothetical protein
LLQRGVSIFTLVKILLIETKKIGKINMTELVHAYSWSMVIFFLIISIYIKCIEKEFWKKVALLIFAMVSFPYLSADYRLIHGFIPLYLFVNSKEHTKLDLFYAIVFASLLIPKDYYLLPGIVSDSGDGDISISVVFNVVIVLVMMLVIIESGVAKWRKIGNKGVVR